MKPKKINREVTEEQIKEKPDVKDIEKLVASLNKKFGDNAIHKGIPEYSQKPIKRVSTGSVSLDVALGGGLPLGRFTEISGLESSSKSTLALHIVRNAQEMGLVCAYIDVECTTDQDYIRSLGVDYENLIYSNPGSTEEALQMLVELQKSGVVHLAVLDSIAALSPNKEMDTDLDEKIQMGVTPSLLGEFFRKYQMHNNGLQRSGNESFTLIGINQLREKIGAYGDPSYSPGGKSKGFTASVALRIRRGDWISEGKGDNREVVGQVVKFMINKNKTGRIHQSGEYDFYFSENSAQIKPGFIDNIKELIILCVEHGVIIRGGAWFNYGDLRWQGQEKMIESIRNDQELMQELREKVNAAVLKKKV